MLASLLSHLITLLLNAVAYTYPIFGSVSEFQPTVMVERSISDMSCPPNSDTVYNCNYTRINQACPLYNVISCVTSKSLMLTNSFNSNQLMSLGPCNSGSMSIANATSAEFPTSRSVITGRVQICIDGEQVDVCADAGINQTEFARLACQNENKELVQSKHHLSML